MSLFSVLRCGAIYHISCTNINNATTAQLPDDWENKERSCNVIIICDLCSHLLFTIQSQPSDLSLERYPLERFKLSEWSIVPLLLIKTTSTLPYYQIIAFTGKALMTVRFTVHYIYWTYIIYYTRIRHLGNDVLRIWIDNIRTRFHNIQIVQKVIYKLIAQYKVLVLDLLVC